MNEVKRETKVAILTKGSVLTAAIVLDAGVNCSDGNLRHIVGSLDPRCNPAAHIRSYATPALAGQSFDEALVLSAKNGWTITHLGPRNWG